MDCIFLEQIKDTFDSLWSCHQIDDETLKITTPFASLDNKYIDLLIKEQNHEFIVTDGGYIDELTIASEFRITDKRILLKVIDAYLREYEISKLDHNGMMVYYKKTSNIDFVANCVLEMADFARTVLSHFYINSVGEDDEDIEDKKFALVATDFVKEQYSQSEEYDLRFNELIGFDNRKKRVSVAFITPSTVNAVQFLSGGTFYYFKSRIMNTSGDFELLGDYTPLNKKLALYDDATDVYGENRAALDEYLSLLNSRLSDPPIPWSQRDRIKTLIS